MYGYKFFINRLRCDRMRHSYARVICPIKNYIQAISLRSYVSKRVVVRPIDASAIDGADESSNWPRKIFSGIQPTGRLHIGNYLGAVCKWKQLQESREDVTYCIVDMHSITLPQEPIALRDNIFRLAATMLACGINPKQSTVFVQSAVKEHSELCWLLGTICTMARLGHLPQYKEKTRQLRDIPLGLFVYPILQAADILLYKSTHVPVGEDQIQHIQLAQHLAKTFNSRFGNTFPICHAIVEDKQVSRVRSLRDPSKKMSKSDPDSKSAIFISDPPDIVVEKVKKAVTDFSSDVSYDAEARPGVSNLIAIHSHVTGQSIESIVAEARTLDTGKYKMRVADAINEHLKPIREQIKTHLDNRHELSIILDSGAEKARNIAFDTIEEVKHRMGLGAPYLPLYLDSIKPSKASIIVDSEHQQKQTTTTISGAVSASAAYGAATSSMDAATQMYGGYSGQTQQQQAIATATATAQASNKSKQILEPKLATVDVLRKLSAIQKPSVPQQRLRIEKTNHRGVAVRPSGKPINIISDITKGLLNKGLLTKNTHKEEIDKPTQPILRDFPNIRRIARGVEVKPPQTIVAPPSAYTGAQLAATTANTAFNDDVNKNNNPTTMNIPTISPVKQQQQQQQQKETCSSTSQTEKVAEKTAAAQKNSSGLSVSQTALLALPSPLPSPSPSPSSSQSPSSPPALSLSPSSTTSLSLSKTTSTLPAKWPENAPEHKTNQEISTYNKISEITTATKNTTTTATTTAHEMATKTFKRSFTKTTISSQCSPHKKGDDASQNNRSHENQHCDINRKMFFKRAFLFFIIAISAAFGGVYYFWHSVLRAFFDIKRKYGGS